MSYFVGIDTSNYTTSVALCDKDGKIVANEKILLEVKQGERGLRQSDALFLHINNLPLVMEKIGTTDIEAIGCSAYPRDNVGSYMPCFLAGKSLAHCIGSLTGKKVYEFSHQKGHVTAAAYSACKLDLLKERFNAFHVSGGTTELLYCEKLNITNIGGTLDLNAGQFIDRTGVAMGLKFPCGQELERLAHNGELIEKPKVCVKGFECNLSGFENKVNSLINSGAKKEDIALYALECVYLTLEKLTLNLREKYDLPILYSGGVMSNKYIQQKLSRFENVYFAESEFSRDNAAGISLLTMMKARGLLDT